MNSHTLPNQPPAEELPPTAQHSKNRVQLRRTGASTEKQAPTQLQVVLTILLTAVALFSAESLYINRSLESSELRVKADLLNIVTPIKEKQAEFKFQLDEFKLLVSLLSTKSALSPEDKESVNSVLRRISYEDVEPYVREKPKQAEARKLFQLKQDNEITQTDLVQGLVWDGDRPAQIRFIRVNNPALDLNKIDLYSDGPDGCRSKVLQSSKQAGNTVQVCEAHLNSNHNLEFTVVVKPEGIRHLE